MPIATSAALLIAAAAQPGMPAAVQAPLPPTPLILDQNRADRAPVPASAAPRAPKTEGGSVAVGAGDASIAIHHIAFQGTKVPARVAAAAEHFLGQPASKEVLAKLAGAMADAYTRSDVALYTIAVPEQTFAGGNVRIVALEGYIESVRFTGGETRLLTAYAAALAAEKPLTRRTLQRYLSLMRDVPGSTIDVQLLRGSKPGAVILQIGAKRKGHEFALGFDNQGNGQLGQSQLRAESHGYSLLRDGDRTDLTGLASPDFHKLLYVAASHTTPIGSDGITLSGSLGALKTRPRGASVDGDARTFGLSAAYPLIRGYTRNLTLSLGLDGIDSDAALFGTTLSSDHTRTARLAAGFSQSGVRSAFSAGVTLSRGLDILAAHGTPGFTDTLFTKLNGRVTYDRQLAKQVFVHLRAAGQESRDKLAPAERFAVGGPDFGRAFDQALLTGDRGIAGSAELALRPKLPAKVQGSELYAFVDDAKVGIVARYPYLAGNFTLASAGGGVRLVFSQRGSITVEGARNIDNPYPAYRGKWRVNISWRLALARR